MPASVEDVQADRRDRFERPDRPEDAAERFRRRAAPGARGEPTGRADGIGAGVTVGCGGGWTPVVEVVGMEKADRAVWSAAN